MRKFLLFVLVAALFAACEKDVEQPVQDEMMLKSAEIAECVTLQNGVLTYSAGHYLEGEPIQVGYDIFGYNYQAHMFNGSYANAYLGRPGTALPPYDGDDEAYLDAYPGAENHWAWEYRNEKLMMKWNDAWLSNQDCDGDGALDRHYGFVTYIGSGAWLTNHQSGVYTDENGNERKYTYSCKIVAPPADAMKTDGLWYAADGTVIGPVIWGSFAITQEVGGENGERGLLYKSDHPGLGNW